MSFPCVNPQHFDMIDGTHIQPKDYMQWRHVATNLLASTDLTFTPIIVGGPAPNADVGDLMVTWLNDSPIAQRVYCMITRGGTRVVTQARGVAYCETYYAITQGAAPADPVTTPGTLCGRYGNGSDPGVGVDGGGQSVYLITETRCPPRTYQIGDLLTLPATQTVKFRIRLRWQALQWETVGVDGTDTVETESSLTTGETRLDIFAIPSL